MDTTKFNTTLAAILDGRKTTRSTGPKNSPVPKYGVQKVGRVKSRTTKTLYALETELLEEGSRLRAAVKARIAELSKGGRQPVNIFDEVLLQLYAAARQLGAQQEIVTDSCNRSIYSEFPEYQRPDLDVALCDGWVLVARQVSAEEATSRARKYLLPED